MKSPRPNESRYFLPCDARSVAFPAAAPSPSDAKLDEAPSFSSTSLVTASVLAAASLDLSSAIFAISA